MNFHLVDGQSFLRMQDPENYDDLSAIRPMLQHVHKEKNPLSCYEIGSRGAFYRIIQPVFHQDSYVGVLELGIDAHSIMESLKQYVSDPLTTFFVADKWKKVTRDIGHEFQEYGGYNLINHNIPLYKQLPHDLNILLDNQRLTVGNKVYLLHPYPIFNDFKGSLVGGFIVMQDISEALKAKKKFVFQSLTFSCILLTISLVALYLSFGRLIDKLEKSRLNFKNTVSTLGMEVIERKQTEKQLGKSKKEWERTFNAIGDIVTILNSDLQIVKANRTAYKRMGEN